MKNIITALLLMPCLLSVSMADEHHRRGHEFDHRNQWHGEIHRFHDHDIDLWRQGRWHRGWHDRRLAWWWITGGIWYFYPARVEPYPDPYQPPVVAVPPPPTPPQYWYYCANPAGYYPYVARCAANWQHVPATTDAPFVPPN